MAATPLACLAVACVDTSGKESHAGVFLDEPEPIVIVDENPVPKKLLQPQGDGPYTWQNVTIKGGGFVTGIEFSKAAPNLIYARTDVGGAYRYDVTLERWLPLTDWIGQYESNLMGIESIATDPSNPERVYIAAGTYLSAGSGVILKSEDFGVTWEEHAIGGGARGVPMGGNHNGRSMGERLAVDPNDPEVLFFASRQDGLWRSEDAADTWEEVEGFPTQGDGDLGLSFVLFDPFSGEPGELTPVMYVGVATLNGDSLWRSRNGGKNWGPVEGTPSGLMPHHAAMDSEGVIYFAFNDGPGPNDIVRGGIFKLEPDGSWQDISPADNGFGGISVDWQEPGSIVATAIATWSPDEIYRSRNGGRDWYRLGRRAERDTTGAEYLYFQGSSLAATGWMGDVEIDPFNRSRALYITGQGIWWSDNVTDSDADEPTSWRFENAGLEETVALDLVSPPKGAPLLSAVGDIAGFRHDDLDRSPESGMYNNPLFGNTESIDFAELEPSIVVRVGTRDGIAGAISTNGGRNWRPFASEPDAGSGEPAQSGSVAVSADGSLIAWAPSNRGGIWISDDGGDSWSQSSGMTGSGAELAADRVDAETFYAIPGWRGGNGFYVSTDGGTTFSQSVSDSPRGRPRPVFGQQGHVWVPSSLGLYHSDDRGESFRQIESVDSALAVGFGKAAPDVDYPAIYLSGTINGDPGLFRSDDVGETWVALHDEAHHFGYVSHITGDPRIYGRVYLGTGGRGIVYGDPRDD